MNFSVLNNRLIVLCTWWRWSVVWKPERKQHSQSMTTCQLWVSDQPATVYCELAADTVIGFDVFPVILQNLRPSGVLFSKETVCEKFQITREKVVVTVTTTFKSGGDMSSPSHTKLRLCILSTSHLNLLYHILIAPYLKMDASYGPSLKKYYLRSITQTSKTSS